MLQGGAYTNNRNFVNQPQQQQQQQQQVQVVQRQSPGQQLPPVRSLTSPGARGSPFSPDGQYPRLTRTISAPPPAPHATTQLPGNPPLTPPRMSVAVTGLSNFYSTLWHTTHHVLSFHLFL